MVANPKFGLVEDRIIVKQCVLNKGTPPSNGREWKDWLHTILVRQDAVYLMDPRFNQIHEGVAAPGDLVAQLDLLEPKRGQPTPVIKKEGGYAGEAKSDDEDVVLVIRPPPGRHAACTVFNNRNRRYVDPIASVKQPEAERAAGQMVAEDQEKHKTRMTIFGLVMESLRTHHNDLAQSVAGERWGDVLALTNAVQGLINGREPSHFLNAIKTAVTITKAAGETWLEFIGKVNKSKTELDLIVDEQFRLGPQVLVEVCLQAMTRSGSNVFAGAAALLRIEQPPPNLERTLSRIHEAVAQSGETGAGRDTGEGAKIKALQATINAMQAAAGSKRVGRGDKQTATGSGNAGGRSNICWHWRDKGKCPYTNCIFEHPKKVKFADPKDVCPECLSPSHGIQTCSVFKTRKATEAKQAAMEARVAEIARELSEPKIKLDPRDLYPEV